MLHQWGVFGFSNTELIMKTYIEFGAPEPDMSYVKSAKKSGYKTIVIDFEKYDFMDEEYYKLLVDETYLNYWSDPLDIPLADSWVCFSSLEHTPYSDVHKEVEAIVSKVSGPGEIGIDLTDHSGGFTHIEFPENFQGYPSTGLYLNGINYRQWIDIISEYFTFDRIDEMACIEGKWSPVEKKNEDGTLTSGKRNISKDQVGHINFKNCEVKE